MPAKKIGYAQRLRYAFDKTMAAGAPALVGWLAVISLIVIALASLFLVITGITPEGVDNLSFGEAMWESLMRTLDSGTMGGDAGWSFRMVMLVVTLAGIFIVSALIGILSSGLEAKLDELRKGRSVVLEENHSIILNWSPSVFDILGELAIANESERRPRVVIMADKDKVEMEDEIAAKAPKMGRTKVICRSGDPTDLADLQIVNPQAARSVIITSPEGDAPDAAVIKSIVALVNDPGRRAEPYRIAAEIRDPENAEIARAVGGAEAQLVLADELIARIMVHSSRETGLSGVYTELLDFDGSEIYAAAQPSIVGLRFGDALLCYDGCCLIGLVDGAGRVEIHPDLDRIIAADDVALIIAEDDTTIVPRAAPALANDDPVVTPAPRHATADRTLILGWNRRGPTVVRELSRHVVAGSELTIATPGGLDADVAADPAAKIKVTVVDAEITRPAVIEGLDVLSYDQVLVLGASDDLPAQTADTHTLVTLLHLRRIAEAAGKTIDVVSEMIDVRNRQLAEVTRANDFVVSNKLVSLMLAQASENPYIAEIFAQLLDAEGTEIHLRPASDYVPLGQPVDFHLVTRAARRQGQVAIGHARAGAGVVVNPPKTDALAYGAGDRIIVLARD